MSDGPAEGRGFAPGRFCEVSRAGVRRDDSNPWWLRLEACDLAWALPCAPGDRRRTSDRHSWFRPPCSIMARAADDRRSRPWERRLCHSAGNGPPRARASSGRDPHRNRSMPSEERAAWVVF